MPRRNRVLRPLGLMLPEMAGAMVGGEAQRRHVETGGRHPLDDD